ncbi:ABC transporter ATP-binding protein [Corynebacterium guangdongense]|uniref:Spermidine/putrescine transport system ATP-binding protein n=1 Tax=Corynebacterium guangdongense TaxID=1783348 RepID=A0ABU1ZWQ5_9CORY|nr:ABC transporter ATP-binding protein [Corynebacterium guangdongense]MDR7328353.1 putative spermidine/putrescine transport system ATP-binding protein [Corynebacterium guangdongense]WJZ16930.1 Sulfate/thiosulfate import ATP-binding protein CysA [Corynebacterium guangdongense]
MSTPHVQLRDITKIYGENTVLDRMNLTIDQGELVSLLGPSGGGKSTALRVLAGLESADGGQILIDGRDVSARPTRERNMGIVFQAYSLFPHLTATENVAYGLKIRGRDRSARTTRAQELLELVGLSAHMDKYPAQLSGGQQQRVALARALAIEPEVLLLDEPLSALDAKVRVQLRDEIRRIQQSRGIATLMVTHDQEEAIVMSDRVAVIRAGQIEQIGTPAELYHHPQTPFISQFVGVANRIVGSVHGDRVRLLDTELDIVNAASDAAQGEIATGLIRPEQLLAHRDDAAHYVVVDKQLRGIFSSVTVQGQRGKGYLRMDMPTRDSDELAIGDRVRLTIARTDTVIDVPNDAERETWANLQKAWSQ